MTTLYPNQTDLQHRLRRACLDEDAKPLVLMLGSGASIGSVPDTSSMVNFFERSIASDPEDAEDFANSVRTLPAEQQYQTAAQFLIDRAGLSHLNRVIRMSVIRARTPPIPAELARDYVKDEDRLKELEEDFGGWALPQGLAAIGRIMNLIRPESRGPILTTNFDPLAEVSLRAAGLDPFPLPVDHDGGVTVPEALSTLVPVVHLHGYWRQGDTMHTGRQLTTSRPKLIGSLRQILSNSTCLVLGYGGWDDMLTRSILDIVSEGSQRELDVLWACNADTPQMGVVTGISSPGRIQPYVSVDANSLLKNLERALEARISPSASSTPTKSKSIQPKAMAGCLVLDSNFIDIEKARNASNEAALAYFDGREPSWFDITSGRVPILSRTTQIIAKLQEHPDESPATLLEGPTGEGKSTIIRQVAAHFARDDRFKVLWAEPGARIDVDALVNSVVSSRRTIVLIDDADLRIDEIANVTTALTSQKRKDVSLVLAARDTDWQRSLRLSGAQLDSSSIETMLVSGLTFSDAEKMVDAWTALGQEGLGKLAALPSRQARVERLHEEGLDSGNSALLGAMLVTRYGDEFRSHIQNLLERLGRISLPKSGTLLDVYVLICLLPAISLQPVKITFLSWMLRLSVNEVQSLVVERLGREAAASRHGDQILPRHKHIADATINLSSSFNIDTHSGLSSYISAVIKGSIGTKWDDAVLDVAFSGQKINQAELAYTAADAAVDADPSQLRLRSSQIGVYREGQRFREALEMCDVAWSTMDQLGDAGIALRPFLRQWARVSGQTENHTMAAALNACSLLDIPSIDALDLNNAVRGLSALALSLTHLQSDKPNELIKWRGILPQVTLELVSPSSEVHSQATHTLALAIQEGYEEVSSRAERREGISRAVRFAVNVSGMSVARRYRMISDKTRGLFDILGL